MLIVERDYKIEVCFIPLVLSVDDGACEGTPGVLAEQMKLGGACLLGPGVAFRTPGTAACHRDTLHRRT